MRPARPARPACAFSPSASSTSATSASRASSRANAAAPSPRPSPGPNASAPPRSLASSTLRHPRRPSARRLRRAAPASSARADRRSRGSPAERRARTPSHTRPRRASLPAQPSAARPSARASRPRRARGRSRTSSRTLPSAAAHRAPTARSGRSSSHPARPAESRCRSVSTSPACALPGAIHRPGFPAWKVTVAAARTAAPDATPVEASTPLGTSTLTTGALAAFTASIASANRAAGLTLEAGAQQRVHDHRRPRERLLRSLADPRLAPTAPRLAAAPDSRARPRRSRPAAPCTPPSPRRPASRSRRADHQPVPAVVSLPADHRHGPIRGHSLDRPRHPAPARSIKSSEPTPRSSIAQRSTARIVSASSSGSQPVGKSVHDQRC